MGQNICHVTNSAVQSKTWMNSILDGFLFLIREVVHLAEIQRGPPLRQLMSGCALTKYKPTCTKLHLDF